jgi:hypothetical protein
MAQPVGADRRQPSPARSGDHDVADPTAREALVWRMHSHEHSAVLGGRRTACLQVVREGLTNICRQGKSLGPPTLSTHENLSGTPIDVIE